VISLFISQIIGNGIGVLVNYNLHETAFASASPISVVERFLSPRASNICSNRCFHICRCLGFT
jgi:hypothetical protein